MSGLTWFATLAAFAQATEIQYLSGRDVDHPKEWSFRCSDGMRSGKWQKIEVPSNWEQQGFGDYTYGRYYLDKDAKPSSEIGEYKCNFRIPKSWKGKKIEIVFEGSMTDTDVRVNGSSAGPVHQGGFTRFCYDITPLVKFGGKNTLEVTVAKQSKDDSVNGAERRADWWLFGGIYRPVYLRALPMQHIGHVAIDARADGTLNARLQLKGVKSAGYGLEVAVDDREPQRVVFNDKSIAEISTKWADISLWDPEHPNVHNVSFTLLSPTGEKLHRLTERVGFRTVEFRPRDGFYLNGTKLQIRGVNRHCFYPETGRAGSKERDVEDVKLIKGMNANAIRSHYPPDAHLLDICDSLGVLYLNELPGWQNAYSTEVGTKILHEMIERDVNHPSIFAWSNGNEGGFNYDLDPLLVQLDPQGRHVVHAWADWNGVDAHHYPAYQTGVGRLGNGHKVFMPTEFLHSQYDKGAGASLDEFWENWSKNPLFAGGFIWAWADEGVARTDRGGEIDTDGPNGPDGIVGPHREKEASWFTVRDVWSPIQIDHSCSFPLLNDKLTVKNNSLFSKLDEYRLEWNLNGTETESKGNVKLPAIDPGESANVDLCLPEGWKNADYVTMTAFGAQGDTIAQWSWPTLYADQYFARKNDDKANEGRARIEGNALEANGIRVEFDPANGMLAKVIVDDREVPFNNGPLPVGMHWLLKSISSRMDGNDALMVMHYAGAADSIVWRMRPDGTLGMDALMLNRKDGGGFEGKIFDNGARNVGITFSYPEENVRGMEWLGMGPYRVWRNRERGINFGRWQKDYNNTVTGESTGTLVYPEFKGYHGNIFEAKLLSDSAPLGIASETDGLYMRVFTPEEPKQRRRGEDTMVAFPDGDISFLLEIPAIRSYKPLEQLGPRAQPANIRINKGDEGLRIKLWFSFR